MDRAHWLSFTGAVSGRASGLQWYGTDRSNLLQMDGAVADVSLGRLCCASKVPEGTGKTGENGQHFTQGSKTLVGLDRRLPLTVT